MSTGDLIHTVYIAMYTVQDFTYLAYKLGYFDLIIIIILLFYIILKTKTFMAREYHYLGMYKSFNV